MLHYVVEHGKFKIAELNLNCVSLSTKFELMSTDSAFVSDFQPFTVT
jgi:hypothetical protein